LLLTVALASLALVFVGLLPFPLLAARQVRALAAAVLSGTADALERYAPLHAAYLVLQVIVATAGIPTWVRASEALLRTGVDGWVQSSVLMLQVHLDAVHAVRPASNNPDSAKTSWHCKRRQTL
jgi:hypothetical protein